MHPKLAAHIKLVNRQFAALVELKRIAAQDALIAREDARREALAMAAAAATNRDRRRQACAAVPKPPPPPKLDLEREVAKRASVADDPDATAVDSARRRR